jgi:hypothetical protein
MAAAAFPRYSPGIIIDASGMSDQNWRRSMILEMALNVVVVVILLVLRTGNYLFQLKISSIFYMPAGGLLSTYCFK